MNLIFIGLSGSGKSTFGEYCAALTGKRFIDVDREIENEYGKISEIFSSGGESLFRAIEEKKLIDLAETKDGIIGYRRRGGFNSERDERAEKQRLVRLFKMRVARTRKADCRKQCG